MILRIRMLKQYRGVKNLYHLDNDIFYPKDIKEQEYPLRKFNIDFRVNRQKEW